MSTPRKPIRESENNVKKKKIKVEEKTSTTKRNRISTNPIKIENETSKPIASNELKIRTVPKNNLKPTVPLLKSKINSVNANTAPKKFIKPSGVYNQKNVTINSPKHKRKVLVTNLDEKHEPSTSKNNLMKSFDINNHVRHRTRTLDPDEVKIINKIGNAPDKIIFPPESFFVPMQVNNDTPDKIQIESDDSITYEDDFESYESDFDSYASSHKSSSSSTDDLIEVKAKIEEKFDSGNYELGDSSKALNAIQVLPHYTSLTDEGFDENSGLLSLNPNIDTKRVSKKYSDRSNDLRNLITLDEVYYSLFEMIPMPYDTFIINYGKSNRSQVSSQTGDDNVDCDTQTDAVIKNNKWTQYPIDFSNTQKASHLEIYVNQKSGSGTDRLNNPDEIPNKTDVVKLSKFMSNVGSLMLDYLIERDNNSDISFNDLSTSNKHMLRYVEKRPIRSIFTSQLHPNIFITSHPRIDLKNTNIVADSINIDRESILSIWELKNKSLDPVKFLITSDEVVCCCINSGTNGIVVAGLEYGNIIAWDLSENDVWHESVNVSETKNETITFRKPSFHTSCDISKSNTAKKYQWGSVVDVTFIKSGNNVVTNDQVYSLQEYGVLTIWTIIHTNGDLQRISSTDYYDSHWSRISLIKTNVIDLKKYLGSELKCFSNVHKRVEMENKCTHDDDDVKFIEHDKKGIIRAFSDEDFFGEVLIQREYKPTSEQIVDDCIVGWERSIICNNFKNIDYNKALLIVCNGSRIIKYIQSGLRRKPIVFSCGDVGSSITDIEACPSNLNYFLTNCGNVIHLYSLSIGKPIKNFNYNPNKFKLSENSEFLGRLSEISLEESLQNVFNFESSKNISWKKFGMIQWPINNPYTIIKVYNNRTIGIWDLMKSDISPKMFLNIHNDNNDHIINMKIIYDIRNTSKCYMILCMYSGKLKIYHINKKYYDCTKYTNINEDLNLLHTYFKLL